MQTDKKLVKSRTIIIGAGKAGSLLAEDINQKKDSSFSLVGFLDDNIKKNKQVCGLPVLGKIADLPILIVKLDINEVIIALPSSSGAKIRTIINTNKTIQLSYKILPRTSEVLLQDFSKDYLHHVRDLLLEDLIGGNVNKIDLTRVKSKVEKETFFITGAAGSIGSELSRQVATHGAKKVIFYDWWENGMFELRNELITKFPDGTFEFIIGDIKDVEKINHVIKKHKPDTIFHAAAYKHVPLMESNGVEAIKNNIRGTQIVAMAAVRYGVAKFVMVSSDKAVNPTNIMGATKRAAEKMIHIISEGQDQTIFCSVRFGNVMNSNGSVIPIFKHQIESGGPVTVTHKGINRFFMTIPEAVSLILKAWIIGENNDLFVLDMGEPIKIYNLAEWMIVLKGLRPHEDIAIDITGLRPGEKLYEEVLIAEENVVKTSEEGVFRTQNYLVFDKVVFLNIYAQLEEELKSKGDISRSEVHAFLQKMVSTFKPAEHSK